MKISLTCQSSAGFAGNTVFTTQCLQKAKLLPTSGCVDRSFIIIIIIALLGVIIDHHHHHHHYTPGHGHPPSSLAKHSVPAVPWCCSVALRGGGDSLTAQWWSRWRWRSGGSGGCSSGIARMGRGSKGGNGLEVQEFLATSRMVMDYWTKTIAFVRGRANTLETLSSIA